MFTVRSIEQPGKQRGVVMIMTAIALISIVMMAGLAFGVSQVSLDRTRLQNVLDATALGAARVLNLTGDADSAIAAADELFLQQTSAGVLGNEGFASASLTTTPGPPDTPGTFVRVHLASSLTVITLLPVNTTAVAGPSAVLTAANVVPILVCGDPASPPGTFWGFTIDDPAELSVPAGGPLLPPPVSAFPNSAHVQILSPSPAGGNLTEMIAGAYDGDIAIGDVSITTAGANTTALADGIRARFGGYYNDVAGMDATYPPDLVIAPGNYALYRTQYNAPFLVNGAPERRVLVVPIGDCTGLVDGAANDVPILGLGCFFLNEAPLPPPPPPLPPPPPSPIAGQFIANCNGKGTPGNSADPATPAIGPTQIILYGDPHPAQWGS